MMNENKKGRNQIGDKIHLFQDEIKQFCANYQRIHLYGDGYVSNMIYEYLKEDKIIICDVIVSDGYKKAKKYREKYDIFEISETNLNEEDGIIICVREELQEEIAGELKKCGIKEEQIYHQKIYKKNILLEVMKYSKINDLYENENGYFSKYIELNNIGKMEGTDKSNIYHDYLNKYEFFLKDWKQREFTLLELGILKGASLSMWGKYFEKAILYGVDCNAECAKYESENCKVIIGDLGDEEFLDELGQLSPTIIIDDASHLWSHQIKAIYHLIPALKSGGVFIMEDLETSFPSYRYMDYDDAVISTYDFCSALAEVVSSREYLRNDILPIKMFPLKKELEKIAMQIEMISFIHGSCIMIKR